VLLVIQLLRLNGFFFHSVMDFFLCVMVYVRAVVRVIHGVTCRLPVYRRNLFLSVVDFFMSFIRRHVCISPVYLFRVVDVLCAVIYSC